MLILGNKRRVFVGDGLLSHTVTHALPSTLVGLTAGFEMDPGVPPPLLSPTKTRTFQSFCLERV